MSAILCGKRSSFTSSTSSVSKRIRTSPLPFSTPKSNNTICSAAYSLENPLNLFSNLDHLATLFPHMDKQLCETALAQSGDDLDLAIRRLNELQLGSTENLDSAAGKPDEAHEVNVTIQIPAAVATNGEDVLSDNTSTSENIQLDGADWVELLIGEIVTAPNMDDARIRAFRALEMLEKSIIARAAQGLQQENNVLKEQLNAMIQENSILKRAVSIQHERQKEFEDNSQELHNLKQLISQYQEQLRSLEINNYALRLHLKQAQEGSSIPGRFHPDVF